MNEFDVPESFKLPFKVISALCVLVIITFRFNVFSFITLLITVVSFIYFQNVVLNFLYKKEMQVGIATFPYNEENLNSGYRLLVFVCALFINGLTVGSAILDSFFKLA